MSPTVHFLGPEGTFAHAAALSRFGAAADLRPGRSVLDVFETVVNRPTDLGVVPIENSIEGSVSLTLEALAECNLSVTGEIVVGVAQCLLGSGSLSEVERVHSHPHALAQCKKWLREHLPHAHLLTSPSTAAAAFAVRGKRSDAAIASELAGKLAGLGILASGIQDRTHNATRFIVLGHEVPTPTGKDKTSILFDAPHERGALYRALGVFDRHDINLSRIESRPMPAEMWHYVFYANLEGHRDDDNIARALRELESQGHSVRVLGSYPRAT